MKCLADSGANKTDKVKEFADISFLSRPGFLRFRIRIMAFICTHISFVHNNGFKIKGFG